MQRLFVISLLVFYVFVSIGIHGVSHFCGDEMVDVALFDANGEKEADACDEHVCCSEPLPGEDEDCCDDVQFSVFYESERSLALTTSQHDLKIPADHLLSPFYSGEEEACETSGTNMLPGQVTVASSTPFYLQYHSLIFYG